MAALTRRLSRSRTRLARYIFLASVLWTILEILYIRSHAHPVPPPAAPAANTRIFITAIAWNSEKELRGFWNDALVSLVQTLGAHNVYVSLAESGSYFDDTRGALSELVERLDHMGVANTVVTNEENHDAVETDLIKTRGGETLPRRIPYLAKQRNIALQPLREQAKKGVWYDRILFLNDVMFTVRKSPLLQT
jgi:hypothetical protein